jgi:hypothetical protein
LGSGGVVEAETVSTVSRRRLISEGLDALETVKTVLNKLIKQGTPG